MSKKGGFPGGMRRHEYCKTYERSPKNARRYYKVSRRIEAEKNLKQLQVEEQSLFEYLGVKN